MSKRLISSGSEFEKQGAYSRAVVVGRWVFVSGTTGYDYTTGAIEPSLVAQTEQTFKNIDQALREAGSSIKDVIRVKYILPDATEFQSTWPTLRKWFGDVRPAATMFQSGLMNTDMKIEIEVTALKDGSTDEVVAASQLLS